MWMYTTLHGAGNVHGRSKDKSGLKIWGIENNIEENILYIEKWLWKDSLHVTAI